MIDYSDMNIRRLYETIFEKISRQLYGIDSTEELKLLKIEADKRDGKLYDNAYEAAMNSYVPFKIVHTKYEETTYYMDTIRKQLEGTKLKIAEVIGASMVNRNIVEGSYVLYDESTIAIDGNVIIAEYKNQKFIKNYYYIDNRIVLKSSNPNYPDIIVESEDDFKYLGVVQMVLNKI